jgi:hypothetical protein
VQARRHCWAPWLDPIHPRPAKPGELRPAPWIEAAQARWREGVARVPMTAIGVDLAQGGDDMTVIAARPTP